MHSATWWKTSAPAPASSLDEGGAGRPAPGKTSAVECLADGAGVPDGLSGPAAAAWMRLENAARTTLPALEAAVASRDEDALARAWSELRLTLACARTDLSDAETVAAPVPGNQGAALRARIAGARTLHDVLEARARQIIDERATCGRADLYVSDDRIHFPATEVGAESEPTTVWVRNLGIGPVSIDELRGTAEFPVHGECEGPLGPGEALEVEVGFRPAEIGFRKATLLIETEGGVRSASLTARGIGREPTAASLERARVAGVTRDVRGHDEVALPRTFAGMRDLILSARELDAVGDREGALRAAVAVHHALRTTCHPARAAEVFARFGMGRQAADLSLGTADLAVHELVGHLANDASFDWDYQVGALAVGRESIELLTGERTDSASFRALQRGANTTLAIFGGGLAGLAAAPVLAGELGLVGHAGASAWRSLLGWAATSPATATAAASGVAGVGIDMADQGGPAAWLESLTTPMGAFGIAFDLLQVHEAHLGSRVATGDVVHETIPCRRGEAAARAGDLRRAGAEVTGDFVAGDARLIRLRTRDGRLIRLVEPGTMGPAPTHPSIRGRINALWLQARAAAARSAIEKRDAQLAAHIQRHRDGKHIHHVFELIIDGGGHAAVLDYATHPRRGAAPVEGGSSPPDIIAVSLGGNTFPERKVPLGQPPQPLAHQAHEGHQPADLSARTVDYTPAQAFGDAVTLTQLESGMATLRGHRVIRIENQVGPDWAMEEATVRLTLEAPDGTELYLYSKAADVVSGPGPGRRLGAKQLAPAWRERMESDGRLLYEAVGRAIKAVRVLVSGGGPAGDWNAAYLAKTGTEVDWVGQSVEPDAARAPAQAAELAEIRTRLASPDLDAAERDRLTRRTTDILFFRDAMLDRNLDSNGAMAQPNVHRRGVEIAVATPSEEMTTGDFAGRPGKVHVLFTDGSTGWYDHIVVSHGQDASLPGGAVAVTQGLTMTVGEANGFPIIQSTDGSVRVLGAATFAREWEGRLSRPNDDRDVTRWQSLTRNSASELSPFSRGIAPSIEMAGGQIAAANGQLSREKRDD